MPRGDGTGPHAMGPMTGRGAGFCAGNNAPGNASAGGGFGHMRGRRRRFSFSPNDGNNDQAAYSPEQEKAYLTDQTKYLQDELSAMQARLKELENKESEEKK